MADLSVVMDHDGFEHCMVGSGIIIGTRKRHFLEDKKLDWRSGLVQHPTARAVSITINDERGKVSPSRLWMPH